MTLQKAKQISGAVLAAVGFGILLNFLVLVSGLPEMSEEYQRISAIQQSYEPLWGLLRLCIMAPLFEELIFRFGFCILPDFILRKFFQIDLPWFWILLSSFIFALTHMNIVQGVYAFLMGILFAFCLIRSGIWVISFLMHFAANFSVYALELLGVSWLLLTPVFAIGGGILGAAGLALFFRGFTKGKK